MNHLRLFGALLATLLTLAAGGAVLAHEGDHDDDHGGNATATGPVTGFRAIEIEGGGTATITIGVRDAYTITGPDEALDQIEAEVSDGTLEIHPRRNAAAGNEPAREVEYTITVRALDELELSGSVSVTAEGIGGATLGLELEDSATLTMTGLQVQSLEADLSGSATATLAGAAEQQRVETADSSVYDARDLESQTATVDLEDSSQATIWVAGAVSGEAEDSARLEVLGENASVSVQTSGSATVTQLPSMPVAGGTPPATPRAAGAAPQTAAETVNVSIVDFAFQPGSLEITAGTTVVWTNTGDAPHTVTAEDGMFDSGRLDTGGEFSFTFDTPGVYSYVCLFHPEMIGTVEVTS